MQKERFTDLQEGLIYKNINDNFYLCVSAKNGEFVLRNIDTDWTFTACGIWQYPDGSIEWDYSVGGHFEDDILPTPAKCFSQEEVQA